MKRTLLKVLVPITLLLLGACTEYVDEKDDEDEDRDRKEQTTDPIVSHWETWPGNECGRTFFGVNEDLSGQGTLYGFGVDAYGELVCLACTFQVDVTPRDQGNYSTRIEFDECYCPSGSGDGRQAEGDSNMSGDENGLDCMVRWGECVQEGIYFDRG